MTSEPTELETARTSLAWLEAEAKRLGIPRSYLHDIDAARAAIVAIERARNK